MNNRSIGILLLAFWLIVTGIQMIFPALHFTGDNVILGLAAIAAGVLILVGR